MLSRQPPSQSYLKTRKRDARTEKQHGGMVTDVKSLMYIPLVSTNPMGPIDRCLLVCVEYHGGKVGYLIFSIPDETTSIEDFVLSTNDMLSPHIVE